MAKSKRKDNKNRVLKDGEYQRPNGSYECKITIGGKRYSISARTLEELREKVKNFYEENRCGTPTNNRYQSLNDLFAVWYRLQSAQRENTLSNYNYMYTQYVQSNLGTRNLKTLLHSDVLGFYQTLHDDRGLKISTIEVIHNVLQQVLQVAVDDEFINKNPAYRALDNLKKAYGSDIEKRQALTKEQQKIFLDFLKNNVRYSHWYPIFCVMIGTGMRVGECVGLRYEDVDLENGFIDVNHTLVYYSKGKGKNCLFEVHPPKTETGKRKIPISAKVKEAFEMEIQYQKDCGLSCKAEVDGYTNFIFINRFGNPQHQGTLNKALRRIVRDCNTEILESQDADNAKILLPKFSCHSLRHTFATRCVEANMNNKVLQTIMGHANIETTLDIYAHACDSFVEDEMKNIENMIIP